MPNYNSNNDTKVSINAVSKFLTNRKQIHGKTSLREAQQNIQSFPPAIPLKSSKSAAAQQHHHSSKPPTPSPRKSAAPSKTHVVAIPSTLRPARNSHRFWRRNPIKMEITTITTTVMT
jgi:hypothetical protein